jgi:hypothetical protein
MSGADNTRASHGKIDYGDAEKAVSEHGISGLAIQLRRAQSDVHLLWSEGLDKVLRKIDTSDGCEAR